MIARAARTAANHVKPMGPGQTGPHAHGFVVYGVLNPLLRRRLEDVPANVNLMGHQDQRSIGKLAAPGHKPS